MLEIFPNSCMFVNLFRVSINISRTLKPVINQSIENAGVAFVKGASERNEFIEQEVHDGPGVAHLSLLTKHNQFPTSCEIYVLPNNKILNSSV